MELNKWEDFRQTVSELKALGDFIWRGQRKAWPLTSSFDRDSAYDDPKTRDNLLNVHRENFKKGMNDSHPGIELGDENDIWALGQHYGLRTPLLDWTKCPHTAAYFAFERLKTTRDDTHRFVYALNETVRRLIRKKKGTDSFRYIDLIKTLEYPSDRFTEQKGVFTRAFNGYDIERSVREYSRRRPGQLILMVIKLPTKDRGRCLSQLNKMGINYQKLRLDLRDVVDSTNNKLRYCLDPA